MPHVFFRLSLERPFPVAGSPRWLRSKRERAQAEVAGERAGELGLGLGGDEAAGARDRSAPPREKQINIGFLVALPLKGGLQKNDAPTFALKQGVKHHLFVPI